MDKIISAAILLIVAYLILTFLVPFLSGVWATIANIVVVIGAIVGLMKIVGMWF
jgi:hypothetical protein